MSTGDGEEKKLKGSQRTQHHFKIVSLFTRFVRETDDDLHQILQNHRQQRARIVYIWRRKIERMMNSEVEIRFRKERSSLLHSLELGELFK
jgi:glutamate synthase domain-containing protein 3